MDASGQIYCIVCGESFRPCRPEVVLCPRCGGPPEANAPESAPSARTLLDSTPPASNGVRTLIESQSTPPPSSRTLLEPVSTRSFAEGDVPAEWQPGDELLDTYTVSGLLGEGGMGKVYRVHHMSWNIDLAVKSPRPEFFQTQEQKNMFISEAETWVDLGLHPHIVTCYYVRSINEVPRVFAELVEGGSLADWIEQGNITTIEQALDIAIQFAWGLAYAHERGLVHRDVKPANVLMTPDGMAKVTDFGLAKAGKGLTPDYASPEQAEAQLRKVEIKPQSDIWSWGLSILEMFAGRAFWVRAEMPDYAWGQIAPQALEHYLSGELEDTAIAEMPVGLVELLKECFQPEPSSRPAGLGTVVDHLVKIYAAEIGKPYHRQQPKAAELRADSLNNKALSMLDLGHPDKAMVAWDTAQIIDLLHASSIYNQGLVLWRGVSKAIPVDFVKMTDETLLERLQVAGAAQQAKWEVAYMLARIHLERGDNVAAIKAIKTIKGQDAERREVIDSLQLAELRQANNRRLLTTFEGHTQPVSAVFLSADGQHALSGSQDGTVKFWDISNGRCQKTLEGHTTEVTCLDMSTGGRVALTGCKGGIVKMWDLHSGLCLQTLNSQTGWINFVRLSKDGRIAIAASNKAIKWWDVQSGSCLRTFEGDDKLIRFMCLSPDGRYAISAMSMVSQNATIKLWDLEGGEYPKTFNPGHNGTVESVTFSMDGRFVLSSSKKLLLLWDIKSGICQRSFIGHNGYVSSASFNIDGYFAVSGSSDNTLRLWEVASGRCLCTFNGLSDGITSVYLSKDGRYALSGGMDCTVKLWEIQLGISPPIAPYIVSQIQVVQDVLSKQEAFNQSVAQAELALDNGRFFEAAKIVRRVRSDPSYQFDSHIMELWQRLYTRLPHKDFNLTWQSATIPVYANCICLDTKAKHALISNYFEGISLWDMDTRKCLQKFSDTKGVKCISISSDGRYALSGKNFIELWEVESGRKIRIFNSLEGRGYRSVQLSGDGRLAISAGGSKVKLWDVSSGQCMRIFEGHIDEVTSVCLSNDCRIALSSGMDGTIRVWELATGHCLCKLEGHSSAIKSLALSTDGHYALSGSNDRTLKLWDLASGSCPRTFEGHSEYVTSVCLSTDGCYALSGSGDKTVKLWDVQSGHCLQTLEGHTREVLSVCLSPDGRYALSSDDDSTMIQWYLEWELDDMEPSDWDNGARTYLENFVTNSMPFAGALPHDHTATDTEITLALTRSGKPVWTEDDFQQLLHVLGCAGYGWLRPEGVRRKLEEMAMGMR